MKRISKRTLLPATLLFFSLSGNVSKAQLISGDGFLQGNYVEVGIAPNGAFGTANSAPTSYHARAGSGGYYLGFVADPDKDGWTIGWPAFFGDFFLPGMPHEGWDIQVNGTRGKAWRSIGPSSFTGGLTGALTYVSTSGTTKVAEWEGTMGALQIKQVTTLPVSSLYFVVSVSMKNTGATTLSNIYYDRTFDADNEYTVDPGSGFTTINKIEYQLPDPRGRVMVSSSGLSFKSFIGIGTRDCRAKAYILNSGLSADAPCDEIYGGTGGASAYKYALGACDTMDKGIGLIFNIGDLAPGDSAVITYAYVLGVSDLDSVFKNISPFFLSSSVPYRSGDTIRGCAGDTIDVGLVNTSFSYWDWTPSTRLATTTGTSNTIIVGDTPTRYRVTGISSVCSFPDTLWFTVAAYNNRPKLILAGSTLSTSGTYTTYEWRETSAPVSLGAAASHTATYSGDYYLIATDVHGCTYYSDTLSVIGTGIEELRVHPELITVYPNPGKDVVRISAPIPVNVTLRDMTGRNVIRKENAASLELDELADGVYFLELTDSGNKLIGVRKLIKQ